jgi:hypothetical protein
MPKRWRRVGEVVLREGDGRRNADGWSAVGGFLAGLSIEERARVGRYSAVDLPEDAEGIGRTLRAMAEGRPEATPALFLATTGAQAGAAGDLDLGLVVGRAALDLAASEEDLRVAHVSLAQTYFRNRREEEHLEAFVGHCREAVRLGHAGTFCYERLAVLHEFRGEKDAAREVCRRAVEALEADGDARSAARFRKRLQRLESRGP